MKKCWSVNYFIFLNFLFIFFIKDVAQVENQFKNVTMEAVDDEEEVYDEEYLPSEIYLKHSNESLDSERVKNEGKKKKRHLFTL